MELWVGAINLGFLYAFMTMGIFITFRVHDFPDITVDGSFTAGAAASAVLLAMGWNPLLALAVAFLAGAAAGAATALIHTRLNINGLLAGILVMTGIYSINLHVMGRSNIPLINRTTFMTGLEKINPGLPLELWTLVALVPVMALFWLATSLFFRTDLGISMRATGNNATMASATGVNVDRMKTFAIAAANGLTGFSGGLVAQYQGFADIGMGIGTVVIGLAAVIMGESVIRARSIYARVLGVLVGSVIFRLMIAFALSAGMNPIDLKLLTALFVLTTLIVSKGLSSRKSAPADAESTPAAFFSRKRVLTAGCALAVAGLAFYGLGLHRTASGPKVFRIGIIQLLDQPMLNLTRDSLIEELKKIGYEDGRNAHLLVRNANGDMATLNTILDDFLRQKMDLVVAISTACTQAAVNKIKDRPVVFATVADPFLIGAGKSATDHLPNVTGVHGLVPMDKTLEVVHRILPGKITIGCLWDPSQANAVHNVEELRKAVAATSDVTLEGITITGSSEVYQGALSLAQKGIDAFVLAPDNIVYSAFESVVKAARPKKIPIFLSDVERLKDGALVALGYDYGSSGIQAAHLIDRIFKGENPRDIPFERYAKLTFGLNAEVARELGVSIPADLVDQATVIYGDRKDLSTR